MLDVLNSYLDEVATPELKYTLEQAFALFERIELADYESSYEEILATETAQERGRVLSSVVELTRMLQKKILTEHGLTLTSEATVEIYNDVIEGILQLGNYEDASALMQMCAMDVPAAEILAELLSLVCQRNADELLVYIDSVENALIVAIQKMAQSADHEVVDAAAGVNSEYVKRLVRFCDKIGTRNLTVIESLKTGIRPGLTFTVYADLIGRGLEAMKVEDAANELVAMALLSCDGSDNPKSVIKENLEHYVSNLDMLTKIDIRVTDLLLGLQR